MFSEIFKNININNYLEDIDNNYNVLLLSNKYEYKYNLINIFKPFLDNQDDYILYMAKI